MLSSSVFANPNPRPASPLPDLRVLRELCVKIPTLLASDRIDSPKTSPNSTPDLWPHQAGSRTLKDQNAKSSPLFSITCALFCNYGGGGVYPSSGANLSLSSLCLSLDPRHHTQVLSFHTLANSFAMKRNTTPLFSDGSKLFKKKHPGGGRVLSKLSSHTFRSPLSPSPSSKTEHHPPRPRLPNHPEFAIRHIAQQLTGRRAP